MKQNPMVCGLLCSSDLVLDKIAAGVARRSAVSILVDKHARLVLSTGARQNRSIYGTAVTQRQRYLRPPVAPWSACACRIGGTGGCGQCNRLAAACRPR